MKFIKTGRMRHTGWLSRTMRALFPHRRKSFLYREYHRQLNDPLFTPACYPL